METVEAQVDRFTPNVENEQYWKHHTQAHHASGLTKSAYCKINKVHYQRFVYWSSKRMSPTPSSLTPIKLKPEATLAEPITLCTLTLNNGNCLRVHEQQALLLILEKLK